MLRLDLSLLHTFVTIAECGTFAAAAERAHRTQSAISQQMQRLEEDVGAALFENVGRGKRLTPNGKRLLRYAKHMLALNDEALRSIRRDELAGLLRIGASQDIADALLPQLLANISQVSPLVNMELYVDRAQILTDRLSKGQLDLILTLRSHEELETVLLRTSPTVWICSRDYVHDATSPLPLILADERSLFRNMAVETLEKHHIEWHEVYRASNLIAIKAAVRSGKGITARSQEMLAPDMRTLGAADGLPPLPSVDCYMCIRSESINPLTREIFNLLKSHDLGAG